MSAQTLIFILTLRFPEVEKFGLIAQIRRSSRSVSACIAEAFRKRRYPANWISKLSDAESEAAETQVWLETAYRCEYITKTEFEQLLDAYDKILAQLVIMAGQASQWCVPTAKR